jgi:hypothetical protein
MIKLYFAGGLFTLEADRKEVGNLYLNQLPKYFGAVSPSNALPYVFAELGEAERAYKHMQHHSSLYSTVDFKTAQLEQSGGSLENPAEVNLSQRVIERLKEAATKLDFEVS